MLDKLAGETENALLRSKGMGYTPLNETSLQQRQFFTLVNLYILPLMGILLILGGIRYRKNRLKKIEQRFQSGEKG